ncbi:TolC family protein [Mucilaginibacter puniceus]
MAHAQQATYTLPQCIDIAIKNNLSVSKSELQVQIADIALQQSRENLLPGLSGNVSHNVNSGRSVDPTSYTYVNRQITTANYGLNGGVTLFNGLAVQNSIKQAALAYQAGKMDFQQVKEMVALNVINAYLQVLNSEDQLVQVNNQLVVSQKQVERVDILDKEGAVKPSDIYDFKGRLASDQLSLINAKNNLNQAKIMLLQIMNAPYDKNINIERFNAIEPQPYAVTSDAIYNIALHDIAIVKAATLRRESAEKGVKVTKGLLLPSISLSGGLYTNYSSGSEPISYVNQFRNNYSTSVGVGLSIPILSAFRSRNRVALAKINLLDAEYTERSTQIKLKQDIEQAYLNMTAAFERYQVLVEQIKAYTGSFNAAEARFNAGVINSVEFVLTKNNLDQANSALISARYDYLIRVKVLDYYQGKLAF